MSNYWYVLFFSLIGGVFSLAGGALLISKKRSADILARYATPFAAGALLAAALLNLLPESLHQLEARAASAWVLGGIVTFFLLEHFLHWFHHHHEHGNESTPAPLVIVGDTIHNFLDGIAIGAAFLIDAPTGIIAAMAVAAHEIPQEIGDFGLLLKFGYSRKKVLVVNALSALASTVGALVTFWLGKEVSLPIGALLALTAGMFIYIAASDLIPTIHAESRRQLGSISAMLLLIGILFVATTTSIAHQYIDTPHEEAIEMHESQHGHQE